MLIEAGKKEVTSTIAALVRYMQACKIREASRGSSGGACQGKLSQSKRQLYSRSRLYVAQTLLTYGPYNPTGTMVLKGTVAHRDSW